MSGLLDTCKKCRVKAENIWTVWEEFERLFPEIKGELSGTFYGAGFPQLPNLEVFPSGRVIMCTWWQAKYIMSRRGKDLYGWLQRSPGSKGPWEHHTIGFQEADSMMVQMPDGSWSRHDL